MDETGELPETLHPDRRNPVQVTACANGRCERFILTIKYELLAHFVVFGKRHLDYLICEFVDYYNRIRSHSSRECLPPVSTIPVEIDSLNVEQVTQKTHVGGLITSFESKAAA